MTLGYVFQIFLRIAIQNQIRIAQRVVVDEIIHFYRKPLEYAQMVLRGRWSIIFPSAAPIAGRRVCSLIIA